MEEYNEEDILWPHQDLEKNSKEHDDARSEITPSQESAPIPIPLKVNVSHSWTAGFNYNGTGFNLDDDDDDDGADHETIGKSIVPPHIFLQRRSAGRMAFSVCVGNGRTLKGRELTVMRDSILRRTGFIEK